MELEGRVAVITGAAKGIGREIAITFAKEGASVVIGDIDVEGLDHVSQEIRNIGKEVIGAEVDISKSSEVRRFMESVIRKLGKIDILVNDAAYAKYGNILKYREDDWDKVIDVGLKGYFLCSQAAAKEMIKKRCGKIISIASIAGEIGFQKTCAYGSAKGGVIALTKVMAVEFAPYGINVNAIAPGPIDTSLLRSLNTPKDIKDRIKRIPFGRLGKPEDVAKAALFLASQNSDYITGHILRVDGGFSAAGILATED